LDFAGNAVRTNALAGITQYNYDGIDHLVSVTDPKTLLTSYGVDGLDNQKQLVSPATGTTNSTYDAAGNLKTSTDARSKVSTYSYDALNRVTSVTFSDTTPEGPGSSLNTVRLDRFMPYCLLSLLGSTPWHEPKHSWERAHG
jgi:YD repeat-containing protein